MVNMDCVTSTKIDGKGYKRAERQKQKSSEEEERKVATIKRDFYVVMAPNNWRDNNITKRPNKPN